MSFYYVDIPVCTKHPGTSCYMMVLEYAAWQSSQISQEKSPIKLGNKNQITYGITYFHQGGYAHRDSHIRNSLHTETGNFYISELRLGIIPEYIRRQKTEIIPGTPKPYRFLMQRCWDTDPKRRPIAEEVYKTFSDWKTQKIGHGGININELELSLNFINWRSGCSSYIRIITNENMLEDPEDFKSSE
ncbi:1955_t:CDS:2 [Ambispora leptoticha]|uniref:1955_t:CDS:1 n=1 Tax=Ambispora leptoticha TaxID=144679 RepID=A0A9N9GRY3_9GLOM|nr:1955_t:CDS:2 [Ambispora leptoticha]